MKLYSFVHSYLSGIQKGIQTAHVVGELVKKYHHKLSGPHSFQAGQLLQDWIEKSPTISVLEGGDDFSLNEFWNLLSVDSEQLYPWAYFAEDSLGGITSAVGIILPIEWSGTAHRKKIAMRDPDPFRRELAQKLLDARTAL